MTTSALYAGRVFHARVTPRRHRLSYRVFMLLADLEELDGLDRDLKLFSRNRFNLIGISDRDYGDGSARPLRRQVEDQLAAAGLAPLHGGPIRMLCMPRVLGRAFNPLTVFFCHQADGSLSAIVYEVTNTFGARRSYVLAAEGGDPVRQGCDKSFFVSPFMDMGLTYAFEILPPDEAVRVAIQVSDNGAPVLSAAFTAARVPLSDGALLRAWATHPLQLVGVLAGIYFEGMKLLIKGLRWRPPPPAHTRSGLPAARREQGVL